MDKPGGDTSARSGILLRLIKDQRVAFLLVGAANTGVGFLFFIGFDLTVGRFLDRTVNEVVGSLGTLACAHVLGVLFAFVMYRRFVFPVTGHVWRDLARFESVYLVSIAINAIILPILVGFGWNRILAQFSILTITVLISYFGHREFSFRRGPDAATVVAASEAGADLTLADDTADLPREADLPRKADLPRDADLPREADLPRKADLPRDHVDPRDETR